MSVHDSLRFELLEAPDLSQDTDWWAIYDTAFPVDEREPRDVILDSVQRRVGIAIRARRGATTTGIASAHLLKQPAAVFLVYVAIAEHDRGSGYGRSLVEHVWQVGAERLKQEQHNAVGLIWEVDDPETAIGPERLHRDRRVKFFSALGGALLPGRYLQPPVDGVAAVPMRLMYRPAEGTGMPDGREIDALIHAIYFEKYHRVNQIPAEILRSLLLASSGLPKVVTRSAEQ